MKSRPDANITLRTLGRVGSMPRRWSHHRGQPRRAGPSPSATWAARRIRPRRCKSASYGDNDTPCVLLNDPQAVGHQHGGSGHALVKERLAELARMVPQDYDVEIVRDQSIFIEASVDTVKEHLVIGGLAGGHRGVVLPGQLRATVIAAHFDSDLDRRRLCDRSSTWASPSTASRCWR